ncbi:MAG: chaperonin GroEL [Phycisphaeraceae bacterium]
MTAKKILYDTEARQAIQGGIQTLAKTVKVTLGPRGRVVVLAQSGGASPLATKDGVTVAKEVELEDPYENMGAQLVREVASRTSELAGDGTTTATVYAESIFTEGLKNVTAGADGSQIKRGIDRAVADLTAELARMAKPVDSTDKIQQVATCSANHDAGIGQVVAEALDKVGKDGVVTVDEGSGLETTVTLVEGMQFDQGYLSPHFVTDQARMEAVFEDAFVFIHEKKLSSANELLPLLEKTSQSSKPLLIVAEDIDGDALAMLVINKLRGGLKVCAVKAPGFGDRRKALLEDLATLTGGRAIMEELAIDLDKLELSDLGRAKKIVVNKDSTTIIEGAGGHQQVQDRIAAIRRQIAASDSDYDREKLQERLAKLVGGVAQINVGGATESEVHEKKGRVEDAVHASRAAAEEGVLPGGGVAVLRARRALEQTRQQCQGDERIGVDIVHRAVAAPLFHIAENAGVGGSVAVHNVLESSDDAFGYNGLTDEYGDMLQMGVLVPVKVERIALEQAASIAGLLLTTDALVGEWQDVEADMKKQS